MIPFDFIVEGPPVSQQTRNRARLQAWKQTVRQAAPQYWTAGDPPSADQLSIIVTNFYDTAAPDVDNIVKPIQDALIELVYNDDNQITDCYTRKRKIDGQMSNLLSDDLHHVVALLTHIETG